MSAPPGSPIYNWQIGLGATFTNGAQVNNWTDQVGGKILQQGGTGSNNSYSSATGLITVPVNTMFASSTSLGTQAQPFTVAMLAKADADIAGNSPALAASGNGTIGEFSGNVTFEIAASTFQAITITNPSTTLHSYLWVNNGASSKLYIDGVLIGTVGATIGAVGFGGTFWLLANTGGTANSTTQFEIGSVLVYASDMSASAAAIDTWLRTGSSGNFHRRRSRMWVGN
jgi:hypothetical protein